MRKADVPGVRLMVGAACGFVGVAAAAMVLFGQITSGAVILGALDTLLWYPIDRVILAAIPDSRQRTDQDRI